MPKIVDREAYRCELLRASFEVAASVGYGSLSMQQLARGIGVSTGSIYNYFESKEDWFVSLVAHYSAEVFDALTEEVPADAPLPRKAELLVKHIERHMQLYANLISVVADFVRLPNSERQKGTLELTLAVDQLYEYFASLFETSESTARVLISQLVGVVTVNRLDPRGTQIEDHLPFIRMITEGAGAAGRKVAGA